MNRYRVLILPILVLLCLVSCSTGPDFERDNSKDPGSNIFKPSYSGLSAVLNTDKSVTLNWRDQSSYESGFIIGKSFGLDTKITILDTLSESTTNYVDDSHILHTSTYYYLATYKQGIELDSTSFLKVKLDFGNFENTSYTSDENEISLSWETSIYYADKYRISRILNDGTEEIIDIVDGGQLSHSFSFSDENYSAKIRIDALLEYNNSFLVIDDITNNNIYYNTPEVTDITLINEAVIDLEFTDKSAFQDVFVVFERTRNHWSEEYSEFSPIDTISSGGYILMSKSKNREREFAVAALKEDLLSTYSNALPIEIFSSSPLLNENTFSVVSDTEVKLTWIDANTPEEPRSGTYHFDIKLYDLDTDELLREIILPPEQTEYTFSNLQVSNKYKATIETYSSPPTASISFFVQQTLKKLSTNYLSSQYGVGSVQILSDKAVIAFNQFQRGLPGLAIFDPDDGSISTISDTGAGSSTYGDMLLSYFYASEDLKQIATSRTTRDDQTGRQNNWIYVADNRTGTPTYYRTSGPDNSYNDETRPLGFLNGNELIYLNVRNAGESGFVIYKWNFESNQKKTLYEQTESDYFFRYASIDTVSERILIGVEYGLIVLNMDGSIYKTMLDELSSVTLIAQTNDPDVYLLNSGERLVRVDLATETSTLMNNSYNLTGFFTIPEQNLIVASSQSRLSFLNMENGREIYSISDSNGSHSFRIGAYLSQSKQVLTSDLNTASKYDLTKDWVVLDLSF